MQIPELTQAGFENALRRVSQRVVEEKKAADPNTDVPLYIVLDDQMLIYRLDRLDAEKNVASLTLFKNPTDFQNDKPQRQIEVGEWQ